MIQIWNPPFIDSEKTTGAEKNLLIKNVALQRKYNE